MDSKKSDAVGKARPGGRTARNTAAIFEAVTALVAERGHGAVTMAEVAERAGVAATSLYRRWGDVRVLITEVAVDQLIHERPLPDTGSLAGDLSAWASTIAASLRSPEGASFFAAIVATAMPQDANPAARGEALKRRIEQIGAMLQRAEARGEKTPALADVLDHLLAPLYTRALFGMPAHDDLAQRLVKRLLAAS
jgi:AcrR family transcriptional regulator